MQDIKKIFQDITEEFYAKNPDFNVTDSDLHNRKLLQELNWEDLDREEVVKTLKTHQRLLRICPDVNTAKMLMDNGIDSAHAVVSGGRECFTKRCVSEMGLSRETADGIYDKAENVKAKTMHLWVSIKNTVASPHFRAMSANNIGDDMTRFFESLPDYETLFGNLDYYECDESSSMIGPAAYFVDLMRIIDQRITSVPDNKIPDVMKLDTRRPDLKSIPLTPEKSETLVPYLQIVNEILKKNVEQQTGQRDAYRYAATGKYPFNLPFNLYLVQIRQYLAQVNVTLSDIYNAMDTTGGKSIALTEAYLELSPEEFNMVTSVVSDPAYLAECFGVDTVPGNLADPEVFTRQTGLSRSRLNELLNQNLSRTELEYNNPDNIPHNFFINNKLPNGKYLYISVTKDAQGNEVEKIENLDISSLDRLNRFIRLAEKLNWSFTDLGWVLTSLGEMEIKDALPKIASIKWLYDNCKIPIEILCSLWFDIKTIGAGDGVNSQAAFDTIFNDPLPVKQRGGQLYHPKKDGADLFNNPLYQDSYYSWIRPDNSNQASGSPGNSILTSGIKASDNDTAAIAAVMFKAQSSVSLTVSNMSVFYRHALMARVLSLSIPEYLLLLKLSGKELRIFQVEDAILLVNSAKCMKAAGFNAYQLDYIINGISGTYVKPAYDDSSLAGLVESIKQSMSNAYVTAASFIYKDIIPDASADACKKLNTQGYIDELGIVIKKATDADKPDLDPLTPQQAGYVMQVLNSKADLQSGIFVQQFAAFLNSYADVMKELVNITVASGIIVENYMHAFVSCPADTLSNSVKLFTDGLSRWLLVQRTLQLKACELASIYTEKEAYGINSLKAITFDNIISISGLKQLQKAFSDGNDGFVAYIGYANGAAPDKDLAAQMLSRLTGWDKNQCVDLAQRFFGNSASICKTIDGIYILKACFDLSAKTGGDIYMLINLCTLEGLEVTDSSWNTYLSVAGKTLDLIRVGYTTDQWQQISDTLTNIIEEQKRNALLGFMLWKSGAQNTRQIYEYLLIDTEMSGMARTTYINQAISSAQLYLQRCGLNLEQGVVKVNIPEIWWEWIMDFRMWQANRQVFLYPENYIDPSLRKNKTSLFKDLESNLQQGEVTKENIEAAYIKYMDQFEKIAKLVYCDAYQCVVNDALQGNVDTLILFAHTNSEPYDYYYITRQRTKKGELWSEWLKIDISINTSFITPLYAFNRLFIFWVEPKPVKENKGDLVGGGSSEKVNVLKLDIKFSYYNFSGNWSQPQTLVADYVADINLQELYNGLMPQIFDMNSMYWYKVGAMVARAANYDASVADDGDEKIIIYFGPMLDKSTNTALQAAANSGYANENQSNKNEAAFFSTVTKNAISLANQMNAQGLQGCFPINMVMAIDGNMEFTYITNANEYVVLQPDGRTPIIPASFRPGINRVLSSLVVNSQSSTIYTNYIEGMGITKDTSIPPQKANNKSFISLPDIDEATSISAYGYLQSAGLIDQDGNVQPSVQLTTAKTITGICQLDDVRKGQIIRNKLFYLCFGSPSIFNSLSHDAGIIPVKNNPGAFLYTNSKETFLITADYFSNIDDAMTIQEPYRSVLPSSFADASGNIDLATSQSIYKYLSDPRINFISDKGIVNIPYVKNATPATVASLAQVDLSLGQEIKDILLTAGPSTLTYTCNGLKYDDNIHTIKFTAQRISAGAVHKLSAALFAGGIDALLALRLQQLPENTELLFDKLKPSSQIVRPLLNFGNQVDFTGPYGNYFWELFFHGPMLIAGIFNSNKKFDDGQKWLKYIFNPTVLPNPVTPDSFKCIPGIDLGQVFNSLRQANIITADGQVDKSVLGMTAQDIKDKTGLEDINKAWVVLNILLNNYLSTPSMRYWQYMPFRNITPEDLKSQLGNPQEIAAYNDDPFDPHAIARLRIGAYEKAIVMKYIDNLLDWGDNEFAAYTAESVNKAAMLYVYAYDLLGTRPRNLGKRSVNAADNVTFQKIYDAYVTQKGIPIPQFLIELETILVGSDATVMTDMHAYNDVGTYFLVPENDVFISYWDRVEDRLYKIRNCLNIDGQQQYLPFFGSPIDPMMLAGAVAQRNSVMDITGQTQVDIPKYRFAYMIDYARSMTSLLAQVGSSLLAALEKSDSENFAVLKASYETQLLNMNTIIKQKQIEELNRQMDAVKAAKESARYRYDYYNKLLENGLNACEIGNLTLMGLAIPAQIIANGIRGVSIAAYLAPNIFGLADGGMQFGEAVNAAAGISEGVAAVLNQSASIVALAGQYMRRAEEWTMLRDVAGYEVDQIARQIDSLAIRIQISNQELAVHNKSIEQSKNIEDFLKKKFTNADLYNWMIGRISTIYFQTYKMALEMALAAQAAYQFELDRDDRFITMSYWDSLHKGLLAGESLMFSLNQLENAYIENNSRTLEIEKTISVFQEFPDEFMKFKYGSGGTGKGTLNISLKEKLYDFDFPGHYCRKIKSVSVSIPAVVGPYQGINATLTQVFNAIVVKPDLDTVKYLISKPSADGDASGVPGAATYRENWVPNQEIAISRGIDDSGMFQLDFKDERYIPFEGTGAVSSWTLKMPPETNKINFDSISDIIIKVKYTARDGGSKFAQDVINLYKSASVNSVGMNYSILKAKYFDMKTAFPAIWANAFAALPINGQQKISFPVTDNVMLTSFSDVKIHSVLVKMKTEGGIRVTAPDGEEFLNIQTGGDIILPVAISNNFGELDNLEYKMGNNANAVWSLIFDIGRTPSELLKHDKTAIDPKKLLDIELVVVFGAQPF